MMQKITIFLFKFYNAGVCLGRGETHMIQATLLRANIWSLQITYKAFPYKLSNIT